MLEDDIEPPVVRWFHAKTAGLPEQMRRELGVWLEVMRNGSTTPPRSKPRSDDTIRAQLAFALPVLQSWAATRDSLREISRADVLAALPPSGQPRATTVQGLRSIFRILRARKLVFTNPTFRIHVPAQAMAVPPAVDLAALRDALDSPSPARAVITALLAYHAIPMRQLARLQLTDIRGGRLHLDDRVILLAGPVRDRVDAYLTYRAATWPASVNAYLFIHARSWKTTRPVTSAWIGQQLAISAEHIRLDRIYQEVEATGGDIRALCDLFGMSIANAARWATTYRPASPSLPPSPTPEQAQPIERQLSTAQEHHHDDRTQDRIADPVTDQLNAAERKLLAAVAAGTLVDLQPATPSSDDPARGVGLGDATGRFERECWLDLLTGACRLLSMAASGDEAARRPHHRLPRPPSRYTHLPAAAAGLLLRGAGQPQTRPPLPAIRPAWLPPASTDRRPAANHGSLELNHGFTARGERSAWTVPGSAGNSILSGASLANPGGAGAVRRPGSPSTTA